MSIHDGASSTPTNAHITWDENGQPTSTAYDDVYFSRDNGLKETHYVFLQHNQLPQRWLAPTHTSLEDKEGKESKHHTFTIAETGFGSGLNFLAAWQQWQEHAHHSAYQHLHFISVEKFPLSKDDLYRSLQLWPQLQSFATRLIDGYPPQPATGIHRLTFNDAKTRKSVTLTLYFGDAAIGFTGMLPPELNHTELSHPELSDTEPNHTELSHTATQFGETYNPVDAWFLDGFAPAKNPDMWNNELFQAMARMSGSHTTFATFTAAGVVKRGLQAAGFVCQKSKGFGRKREMLFGEFSHDVKSDTLTRENHINGASNLWYAQSASSSKTDTHTPIHILVIGGGLAGCHTAFALAEKGFHVTVVDEHSELASQASGNRQGVVYTRLSPFQDPLSRFNMTAQLFADQFYTEHGFYTTCGGKTGVLHLPMNDRQHQLYTTLCDIYAHQPDFMQWVKQEDTQQCTGITLSRGGLFLPKSGWLDPRLLCKNLVKHSNIHVRYNTSVTQLSRHTEQWAATTSIGEQVLASHVVICNAHDALKLTDCAQLPLKKIRGQVSHIPPTPTTANLKVAVCGEGYIAPAITQAHETHAMHSLGSSFNLKDDNTTLSQQDHIDNIKKLTNIAPSLTHELPSFDANKSSRLDTHKPQGKVGFRTTTPDYFPIAGPLPNWQHMDERFAALRKKANKRIACTASVQPQLYCNIALGSRGLAYAPVTADIITRLISGQTLPITTDLYQHLHPARFLIRDLRRNKR